MALQDEVPINNYTQERYRISRAGQNSSYNRTIIELMGDSEYALIPC